MSSSTNTKTATAAISAASKRLGEAWDVFIGGRTAAVWFSFTATCKHLGIDSFAYLRDVLERLPTHPADRLGELLPHRWLAARTAPKAN